MVKNPRNKYDYSFIQGAGAGGAGGTAINASAGVMPKLATTPLVQTPTAEQLLGITTDPVTGEPTNLDIGNGTNTTETPTENSSTYKGVDLSQGFSTKDFATLADYEQAKRKVQLLTKQEIALNRMDPAINQQAQDLGKFNTSQTPQQYNPVDFGQAVKTGALDAGTSALAGAGTGLLAGAIGGATVGAVGGTAVTPVLGTAIGAGAGFIGGLITGIVRNLKKQTSENVSASYASLPVTQRNLKALISDTNQGGDVSTNLYLFQEQLNALDDEYYKLRMVGLKKPLGEDATVQLQKFENFYAKGGARDYLINEMQQAVYNPNPSKQLLTIDDFADYTAEQ